MARTKDLTSTELELTQRLQLLFPRGLPEDVLHRWNGASAEEITRLLLDALSVAPAPDWLRPHSTVTLQPFDGTINPARVEGLMRLMKIVDETEGFFAAFASAGARFCSELRLRCDEATEEKSLAMLPDRFGSPGDMAVAAWGMLMLLRRPECLAADNYLRVFDVDGHPRMLRVENYGDRRVVTVADAFAPIPAGSFVFHRAPALPSVN